MSLLRLFAVMEKRRLSTSSSRAALCSRRLSISLFCALNCALVQQKYNRPQKRQLQRHAACFYPHALAKETQALRIFVEVLLKGNCGDVRRDICPSVLMKER